MRRLIALMTLLIASSAFADDYVVVRNASNPTAQLTANEIKDLFTGKRRQWSNGTAVQVVLGGEDSPELAWLATKFFGVNARQLLSKIKQEVFKGDMAKPIIAGNEQDALEKLTANKGGVGVVSAAAARSLPPGVAVLAVSQ